MRKKKEKISSTVDDRPSCGNTEKISFQQREESKIIQCKEGKECVTSIEHSQNKETFENCIGLMKVEEFEKLKRRLKENYLKKERDLVAKKESEMSLRIQMFIRRKLEHKRIKLKHREKAVQRHNYEMVLMQQKQKTLIIRIQKLTRGHLERQRIKSRNTSSMLIQKIWRGKLGRDFFSNAMKVSASRLLQRVARGLIYGRRILRNERKRIEHMRTTNNAVCKIQKVWKAKVIMEEFRILRIYHFASTEIQKLIRGYLGRKRAKYTRKWKNTEPGIGHLQLGLDKISESNYNLKEHQCDLDVINLTLNKERKDLRNLCKEFRESQGSLLQDEESESKELSIKGDARKNNNYIGMSIDAEDSLIRTEQIVQLEVHKQQHISELIKAKILEKKFLVEKIEKIKRIKDEEFDRMRKNLEKVLQNHQLELKSFNETNIHDKRSVKKNGEKPRFSTSKERETHSCENEKQIDSIFTNQENVLKSYFQNNMGQTFFSTLISNSAKTSEMCATAANIPFISKEFKSRNIYFTTDCSRWTLHDVSLWLQNLSLGKYVLNFEEAKVDGKLLLHLDDQELISTLRVKSNLDRRKILWSIEKMKNENLVKKDIDRNSRMSQEDIMISRKNNESSEKAPSIYTIFDQIQKGRLKSLQESLNNGFEINVTNGNRDTPLIIAIKYGHKKIIDLLVRRGANVNHINSNGNSTLHFALAHDKSGQIGEYLIEKGGDDSVKNRLGLTPYEGLGFEKNEEM